MYGERIKADDKEIFDEVVDAILSVLGDDAQKIILYGSVARGDNTPESDVDIAVITKTQHDWRDRDNLLYVIVPLDLKHDTLFSVKTIEQKHFNDWVDDLPFYHNIDGEGITLWTNKNIVSTL
ncbi:MAG: nucleotidyltransferase domain-containing protein [Synergistaceae bacterium]|nr:nucleotidyltransferase domain-containing protein [Synergistaceae bacterium]